MLQIATGRFWGNTERFEHEKKVTLFSVASLAKEVPLQIGKLAPVESSDKNCAVAEFTYRSGLPIPPGGRQAGVLVAVGDREIEEQFVALLTSHFFWGSSDGPRLIKNLLPVMGYRMAETRATSRLYQWQQAQDIFN